MSGFFVDKDADGTCESLIYLQYGASLTPGKDYNTSQAGIIYVPLTDANSTGSRNNGYAGFNFVMTGVDTAPAAGDYLSIMLQREHGNTRSGAYFQYNP